MRVLVLGATGYVGSRLVPHLLDLGHEVVAASSSPPDPDRFGWDERVEAVRCDVTDAASVARAVVGVDAVVYLVHSMEGTTDFLSEELVAARQFAAAARDAGIPRIVYMSVLTPAKPPSEYSEHVRSRIAAAHTRRPRRRAPLQPCPSYAIAELLGSGQVFATMMKDGSYARSSSSPPLPCPHLLLVVHLMC